MASERWVFCLGCSWDNNKPHANDGKNDENKETKNKLYERHCAHWCPHWNSMLAADAGRLRRQGEEDGKGLCFASG